MLKTIIEYPGYFADENGNIFSLRSGTLRLLRQRLHRGYYRVNIVSFKNPAKPTPEQVHKLVLLAFVGQRPDGMVCRHLNGNALDNRIVNLCWGTPKENARDAMRHGTAVCLRHGENSIAAKLALDDVLAIRKLYTLKKLLQISSE